MQWVRCALGEVVVFHEYRSTRDAGDRGGDVPSPLPGEPHRYTARGGVATVSADPPSRFCLCPVHGYPVNRPTLPAPSRGREEARNAPGGGGGSAIRRKRRSR